MPQSREHILLDPFAIPGVWQDSLPAPARIAGEASLFEQPSFNLPTLKALRATQDYDKSPGAFELPDLAAFKHTALPPLEDLPPPSVSSLDDFLEPRSPTFATRIRSQAQDEKLPEDLWQDPSALPTLKSETRLHTWSSLHHGHARPPGAIKSGLLSEAGPQAFDAAIDEYARAAKPPRLAGRVVRSDALLHSLSELGLGRSSVLFPKDATSNKFKKAIHDGRLSGTSLEVSASITDRFLDMGNALLRLRRFSGECMGDGQACARKMALASVVRVALDAVEEHLVYRRRGILSVLQLQHLFERSHELLRMLNELVAKVAHVEGNGAVSSAMFEKLQELEGRGYDTTVAQAIFIRVSRPWLEELEVNVGLRQSMQEPQANEKSEKSARQDPQPDLPLFLDAETRRLMQETSTCIEHLRGHGSDDQLTRLGPLNRNLAGLEWAFEWHDIDRITAKAAELERSLRGSLDAIHIDQDQRQVSVTAAAHKTYPNTDPWQPIEAIDLMSFDQPQTMLESQAQTSTPDDLHDTILQHLTREPPQSESRYSQIPVDLIPSHSLTPVLRVQHRLLTTQVLQDLLHAHDLSHHLQTLRDFHLFGSGIFTTSLVHVLFAPDAESTERQKHVARSGQQGAMGLRLGSGMRREWPPTSSELSLALAGVLESCRPESTANARKANQAFALSTASETHLPTTSPAHPTSNKPAQTLSFSLRPSLSDSDIERILNPNTIYALDFLTLTFSPPAGLRIIFTDTVLEKYDRIFKFLLRLLRVQFVLGQLFTATTVLNSRSGRRPVVKGRFARSPNERTVQRFRHCATHFISTLLTYIQHTAISPPWNDFTKYIHDLSNLIRTGQSHGDVYTEHKKQFAENANAASLSTLQTHHQTILNKILTLLFLRKRHRNISSALEILLGDILSFASLLQPEHGEGNNGGEDSYEGKHGPGGVSEINQLYQSFETHISAFMEALEAASERAEMGKGMRGDVAKGPDDDGENGRDVVEAFEGLAVLVRWPERDVWD